MTQFIESPEFGVEGGWKLLYRSRDDAGVCRETRVMPVRGLGVLLSTTVTNAAGAVTISGTATVVDVLVVEYLRPVTPEAARVLHRELVTVGEFAKRQPQKKNGPRVVSGSVVSFNVGNGVSDEEQDQEQDQDQVAGNELDGQQAP